MVVDGCLPLELGPWLASWTLALGAVPEHDDDIAIVAADDDEEQKDRRWHNVELVARLVAPLELLLRRNFVVIFICDSLFLLLVRRSSAVDDRPSV